MVFYKTVALANKDLFDIKITDTYTAKVSLDIDTLIDALALLKNKNVIFIGGPGAGKGTGIGALTQLGLYVSHLSTGDALRAEVARGTDLGKEVAPLMAAGDYVPDELLNPIVKNFIDAHKGMTVIFDGYPRTTSQAEYLYEEGVEVDLVIVLDVKEETILQRLIENTREGRTDDDPKVASKRFKKFEKETKGPLVEAYADKVVRVNVDNGLEQDLPELLDKIVAFFN